VAHAAAYRRFSSGEVSQAASAAGGAVSGAVERVRGR
jgi:hypothetical protein